MQQPDRVAVTIPRWVRRRVRRGAVLVPLTHPVEVRSAVAIAGVRREDLPVSTCR